MYHPEGFISQQQKESSVKLWRMIYNFNSTKFQAYMGFIKVNVSSHMVMPFVTTSASSRCGMAAAVQVFEII